MWLRNIYLLLHIFAIMHFGWVNCTERQIISSLSVSARFAAAGIITCEAGNERLIFRFWAEFEKKMEQYKLKAIFFILSV